MKRVNLFFTALLLPLDAITILAAAASAYAIRFSPYVSQIRPIIFELEFRAFLNIALLATVSWLIIFAISGLYSTRPPRLAVEMTRVIIACSAGLALVLAVAFFFRELFDSRFIVLASWLLAMLFILLERLLIRALQRSLRHFGIGLQKIVIIGKTKSGQSLRAYFGIHPGLGYEVVGHYGQFTDDVRQTILNLKKHNYIDTILLANPETPKKDILILKAFSDTEQIGFMYSAELFPGSAVRLIIHTLAGQPVIEVPKTPLDGWGAIYKRAFDIVVSIILIILSLPIQLVAGLAIFLESPGNIFFVHKRVGRSGRQYNHLKFRTMIKDAHVFRFDAEFIKKYGNEREGTPLFKLAHDPRILRVGKIIRKFSIDEIPEFYMVLTGKMSLVGPRPHLPGEVEQYKPHQKQVLTIKPGITGMAQVSGRADLDFNEEVTLDMHYIQNWSPWLDLVILVKTPFVVLFRKVERGD